MCVNIDYIEEGERVDHVSHRALRVTGLRGTKTHLFDEYLHKSKILEEIN